MKHEERDILETIELALTRGYAPGDILDENSPIRDRIRAALHEQTRNALAPSPAAWVNGDELDNLLDDRTAVISGKRDGWRGTALYRLTDTQQSSPDAPAK